MSHESSLSSEITAENSSQVPCSAAHAWAREKRFADVRGSRMAYIERGMGHPIVLPDLLVPMSRCAVTSRPLAAS